MSKAWTKRPLGTCAKFLSGGTPSKSNPDFWSGDIPWVSSGEMTQEHIYDTDLHITEEAARRGSRMVPANTVLVVVRGMSLANEFRISITQRRMAFNQDVKALQCEHDILPTFLFYALRAKRHSIRECATEASHGTKKLEMSVLEEFVLDIPDEITQHRIADILSAYDDLIENNRRRMALLEKAARMIYREWFVRLRFPGHETARIVDGVPEGWEKVKVGNIIAKISKKPRIPKDEYLNEGLYPCIDQSEQFIGGFTDCSGAVHDQPLPIIVFGDHTRRLKFVSFPFASGADGTQLIYPGRDDISPAYLYFSLMESNISNYFYARHFKFLKDQNIIIPNINNMLAFTDIAMDITLQINNLRWANHKLQKARDILLTKLMSGEIEVSEKVDIVEKELVAVQ